MSKTAWVLVIGLVVYGLVIVYQTNKGLPVGVSVMGQPHRVEARAVTFLADRTYLDGTGARQVDQEIFDEVLSMIAGAQQFILIDMFLYNDFQGADVERTRALSSELTQALVAKKKSSPEIDITVVTDPINTVYGGQGSEQLAALEAAGMQVVVTDLSGLRDSNPIYSGIFRLALGWWGNSERGGLLPNPFRVRWSRGDSEGRG
jgi:hypothetical protein